MADVFVINKVDTADRHHIFEVSESLRQLNPKAQIIEGASPLFVDDPGMILHWLFDFLTFLGGSVLLSSLITQRFGVIGFVLAMQQPLALYGVWLLRKSRHQTPAPLYPVDAYRIIKN